MSSLNVNGKRCAGIWPNEEISFTTASVAGFLSLITIPGNLLVLIVVFKNPNGKMRTPFNWFILNLALADLLVGAFVEPLSVLVHIREGLGRTGKYHVYLRPVYFTSCTASVFSLGMLTIDRYIAITSPMKYRATLSNKRAVISSLVIWIISCGFPFLREAIGFLWFFFVFGNASVLVTFFTLLFAFVRVHRSLCAQIRELNAMQGEGEENQARNNALKTDKIIRTFMYMLIAFIICYTPSLILIYLMNLCTVCSCQSIHWFRDLACNFIVLNSSINPFLYAWRLPNFKDAIKLLFKPNRASTYTPNQAPPHQAPPRPQTQDPVSDSASGRMKQISSARCITSLAGSEWSGGHPQSAGTTSSDSCNAHVNEVVTDDDTEFNSHIGMPTPR